MGPRRVRCLNDLDARTLTMALSRVLLFTTWRGRWAGGRDGRSVRDWTITRGMGSGRYGQREPGQIPITWVRGTLARHLAHVVSVRHDQLNVRARVRPPMTASCTRHVGICPNLWACACVRVGRQVGRQSGARAEPQFGRMHLRRAIGSGYPSFARVRGIWPRSRRRLAGCARSEERQAPEAPLADARLRSI